VSVLAILQHVTLLCIAELPAGATTLTLPKADKVRILAISVANQEPAVTPSAPLYDTLAPIVP